MSVENPEARRRPECESLAQVQVVYKQRIEAACIEIPRQEGLESRIPPLVQAVIHSLWTGMYWYAWRNDVNIIPFFPHHLQSMGGASVTPICFQRIVNERYPRTPLFQS
ncbi:MAG: hypothetical protein APF80_16730 [Alphaproteobacteria bacterium BRH_c36]|nr:MAG: hypothetical protein APF80_16730 [Alphaproteobacteria bacterium BRH_c36]